MSDTKPLFSVITVTRNAADTLPPTLQSLAEQTCRLFEHIVIDGASTDDTVKVAREAECGEFKIVSEPDLGLYDAMNKGLGLAEGDYVIFLNAGDTFHSPRTLELMAEAAMDNDYPGIIYGQTRIVDADRKDLGPRHLTAPAELTLDSFKDGMVVCHQAFVVLRKLTNNFDTTYRYSSDYEWCIRCLQRSHRNYYTGEVLIDYLNEGETTRHNRRSLWERFLIMSHYYGLLPTMARHVKFFVRNLRR